jgi:hypothetical protein
MAQGYEEISECNVNKSGSCLYILRAKGSYLLSSLAGVKIKYTQITSSVYTLVIDETKLALHLHCDLRSFFNEIYNAFDPTSQRTNREGIAFAFHKSCLRK